MTAKGLLEVLARTVTGAWEVVMGKVLHGTRGGGKRGGGSIVTVSDGNAYPNKPSGMTLRYSLNPSDPNTPLTGSNSGTLVNGLHRDVSDGGLRTTWPLGMTAGDSIDSAVDLGRDDSQAYQSHYLCYKMYLPDSTFTGQQVQSKLCYDRYGDRAANNQGLILALFNGGALGNDTPRSTLQIMCQRSQNLSGGSIPMYANTVLRADAFWIHTQTEHVIEVYADVGTVDNHDAILRVWIDGALYMDYSPTSPYWWGNPSSWSGSINSPTDKGTATWTGTFINSDGSSTFKMLDSASVFTVGLYGLHFHQVWGGTGGTPSTKQQDDHSVVRQLDYFVGSVLA